ncbi:hypothetical protein EVAR_37916_1 [Eumeta japonica]|uniref:Uncharacterized protein n=1 Tax=Eumeta variegata TaxID=151549 RepID=A0A4C1XC08_EUMVA|nr:hypothetical protein EVAR_37916_1 [Eumeta japonica]
MRCPETNKEGEDKAYCRLVAEVVYYGPFILEKKSPAVRAGRQSGSHAARPPARLNNTRGAPLRADG